MTKRIAILVVVAAAIVVGLYYSQVRPHPAKVSGFVEADEIRLGSRVGGRAVKILVAEGDQVKQGQVLVELDPFDLLERRAEAAAAVAAQNAEYQKLLAGYRAEEIAQAKAKRDELAARCQELEAGPRKETVAAARARLAQAKAEANFAGGSLSRIRESFQKGVATPEETDRALNMAGASDAVQAMRQAELDELEAGTRAEEIQMAKAQLQQAEQAYELLKAGYRKEDVEVAKAASESADASLKVVVARLAELQIRAPADGVIEVCDLQVGNLVSPNAPALTMLAGGKPYVRAFVPETRLAIQPGSKLRVTTDSLPGRRFAGHVTFRSRRAEFSPSNVQTTEKRAEEVFRIKVELDEGADVLLPGMPVDVWLDGTGN